MATATMTPPAGTRQPLPPPSGMRRTLRQMRREWSAYLFIAPGVIIFSVFTVIALIFAFWLTFHEWSIIQPETP
jgi:multiple sugar transport system permease protein